MSSKDYALDLVSIFPETQILIFRMLDENVTAEEVQAFMEGVSEVLGENNRLKLIVTTAAFDVDVLEESDLKNILSSGHPEIEEISTGELCALSLGVVN